MLNNVSLYLDVEDDEVLLSIYTGTKLIPVPISPRAWNTIARYGTPGKVDRRPTKEEGHERVQEFRDRRDAIVDTWKSIPDSIIDTDTLDQNIPWWVKGPFYVAPYVADLLIEIDPMDKYQD